MSLFDVFLGCGGLTFMILVGSVVAVTVSGENHNRAHLAERERRRRAREIRQWHLEDTGGRLPQPPMTNTWGAYPGPQPPVTHTWDAFPMPRRREDRR